MIRYVLLAAIFLSCRSHYNLIIPERRSTALNGSEFYKKIGELKWAERDSLIVKEILEGNLPAFLRRLIPVHITLADSATNKIIHATYFVTADYLSVGNNKDFARTPMTPIAAQQIADSLHCFLPTKKMVDDIYFKAGVKLEPIPLFAFRDSAITFYHHHLMVEGQRQNRKGLIAGIKKDIVISSRLKTDVKHDRVAIYGWHHLNGKPIQPLYTRHVNWYVDYSHGTRLVYRTVIVNGKKYDYTEILSNPTLKKILCDESDCSFYRY